jgi:crotonobetainyl-CoA:carnitine CoA-transferase CaiB-like acyl-CoA transferase
MRPGGREILLNYTANTGEGAEAAEGPGIGPLAKIRVLDFGQAALAPIVSVYLGMLGAEVIKVEPLEGDHSRMYLPKLGPTTTLFLGNNLNKSSVRIDLKSPTGLAAVEQLIQSADVLIENFSTPKTMVKLGLGYERLRELNPQLVYLSASGFGGTGPLAGRRCYEWVVQALAGFVASTGREGGAGEFSRGTGYFDWCGAMVNTALVLLGLLDRDISGKGIEIQTSQLGTSLFTGLTRVAEYLGSGQSAVPLGGRSGFVVPSGAFPTSEGTIIFSVRREREWDALCKELGLEALGNDRTLLSPAQRCQRRAEIEDQIERVLKEDSAENWARRLRLAGLPCTIAPRRAKQTQVLSANEDVQANSFVTRVPTPGGPLMAARPHWTFANAGVAPLHCTIDLGEPFAAIQQLIDERLGDGQRGAAHEDSIKSVDGDSSETNAELPLSGLKVLEIAEGVPGAIAGMMALRFGAEVVKVEPVGGDWLRNQPPLLGEQGAIFSVLNKGKRSVALDTSLDDDRQVILQLANEADIVIVADSETITSGVDVSYESIDRDNPRVVYCSIDGWGECSPRAREEASEFEVQAAAGLNLQIGTRDGDPLFLGFDMISFATGMAAFQATLAGLLERRRTGAGERSRVSMLGVAVALSQMNLAAESATEGLEARQLNAYNWPADHGFKCKDGWVFLDFFRTTGEAWTQFFIATDCIELLQDARFNDPVLVEAQKYLLPALMEEKLSSWSFDELEALVVGQLDGTLIPIETIAEALHHPQVSELGLFRDGGNMADMLAPAKVDRWAQHVGDVVPQVGADNSLARNGSVWYGN